MTASMAIGRLRFSGGVAMLLFLVGCGVPKVNTTRPISSNRGVETLDRTTGDLPQWKKNGSLTVTPDDSLWPEADVSDAVFVRDDKSTQTILARGREITIECSDSKLTIKGDCPKLTVLGRDNEIICDTIGEIRMPGNENKIQCQSVTDGVVNGSNNTVVWETATADKRPDIDFQGLNNSLERIEAIEEVRKAPPRYTRSKKKS